LAAIAMLAPSRAARSAIGKSDAAAGARDEQRFAF